MIAAFRAIFDGWCKPENRSSLNSEQIRRKAAWLRSETVSHLRKHQSRFAEATTEPFDKFLEKAASPSYWINGVLIQALSEKIESAYHCV